MLMSFVLLVNKMIDHLVSICNNPQINGPMQSSNRKLNLLVLTPTVNDVSHVVNNTMALSY